MKKGFLFFWGLWCQFWIIVMLLITAPILWFGLTIFGSRSYSTLEWVPAKFSRIFLFLAGVKPKVTGTDKFNPKEQYIYIFNHSSSIDQYLSVMVAPLGRFIAKAELLKYPAFGIILKHLHIPVRRNDKDDRKRSIKDLTKAVNDGKSPIVYVEGTRNSTEDLLLPFKNGAFILALETNTPIVAVTWTNIRSIVDSKSHKIKPGEINGICDGPFHPKDFKDVTEMKEFIRNTMLKHLQISYPSGKLPLK